MSNPSNYYIARKARFLREFDIVAKSAYSVLVKYFGGDNVNALLVETRHEFENLIPQFPFIGGKQPFTEFVVFTGMLLAIYRVNKARSKTVEETGELVYEIGRAFLRAYPAILLRMFGRMNFSRPYLSHLRKRAIESHQRKYPDDYVYNFIEGDGRTFDYGMDYLECASCKFLAKQGAPELAPYLCPVDILYSETLGWGLMRTMTLAEGADKCDFRFKKGGPTKVSVPFPMQHVIARKED
ncbi:MAG: L-2-amino-thiazoline-4-carboxylic acid hydrolase [Chloroflexi bacterium]|nr:L-2-amino-thiazoline-4-carboxylic acid hydrolase [Chloroflexota bacterium]